MAHSKQARKRIRQSERRSEANKNTASSMRTYCKKVMAAVADGDKSAAEAMLPVAMKRIDKAAKQSVIHANAANRKKRQVMKAVHAM
ncbi:MAG: 30S ribosomal protein S20 [Planctomycetota bacterium]|nr:30S ribosomal protein S20 [Planctomycetota bacterium]